MGTPTSLVCSATPQSPLRVSHLRTTITAPTRYPRDTWQDILGCVCAQRNAFNMTWCFAGESTALGYGRVPVKEGNIMTKKRQKRAIDVYTLLQCH